MALDRHSVIRNDFPMSRRGYDRVAVDRHLEEIAQQVEMLARPSVGAATSHQVQAILDAAEASAAEIERRAWEEASRVQEAADAALARARAHVNALGGASQSLRERLDGLLAEVASLEESLAAMAADVEGAGQGQPVAEEPQDTMAFDPIAEEDLEEPRTEVAQAAEAEEQAPQAPPAAEREGRFGRTTHGSDARTGWFRNGPPAWTGAAATQAATSEQARESARLVALNMADGGEPREVTDAYLADLYGPAERAAILDEIYGGR